MLKVTPLFPEIPLFSSHPITLVFLLPDFAGAYRYPGRLPGLGRPPSPRPPPDASTPAPTPGTPAPGTPAPGTPTPGTPAPGTPTPGTPAPEAPSAGPAPRSLSASPEAARALFGLRPYIEHVLRRCRVPEKDLPDITQDVIVQTLPWWSRLPLEEIRSRPGRCRSYVCTVAVNTANNRHRRSALRPEVLGWTGDEPEHAPEHTSEHTPGDIAAPLPSFSPSAEDLWLEHEEAAERAAAVDLDRLSEMTHPAFWRAFYAHFVTGTPVARIAEAEQTSPATIHQRLRLARRDLRASIRRFHAARRPR